MNYTKKDDIKLIDRMRVASGEGDKAYVHNLSRLSRGGKLVRSHTKRVGDIMRKNLDRRYNVLDKTRKRIENMSSTKEVKSQ
jgi:hypothetical protein